MEPLTELEKKVFAWLNGVGGEGDDISKELGIPQDVCDAATKSIEDKGYMSTFVVNSVTGQTDTWMTSCDEVEDLYYELGVWELPTVN